MKDRPRGGGRDGLMEFERKTNSFGVNIEMVLIVVYIPEARIASAL